MRCSCFLCCAALFAILGGPTVAYANEFHMVSDGRTCPPRGGASYGNMDGRDVAGMTDAVYSHATSVGYHDGVPSSVPVEDDYLVIACSSVNNGCDAELGGSCEAAPSCGCDTAPSTGCAADCGPSCGLGGCVTCSGGCGSCSRCNLGDAWTISHEESCITIGGWMQIGYSANEQPFSVTKGDLLAFNDSTGNIDLHQQWAYVEKAADTDGCCWDWGFRFDMMYGTAAQKTQAFGNPVDGAGNIRGFDNDWDHGRYGWAIPQLYGEIAVGNVSVIAGHFYTLIGYEVVTAPDNFFFSHAFTMFNGEPFTHTGVLATYSANDNLTLYGGWTLGWDTGFDQFDDGSTFVGGFSVTNCCETATFTYIGMFGDLGWRGDDGYNHSLVLDVTLTDKVNYVIQSDFVHTDEFDEDTIGINQYVFYTINDCLSLGSRVEWYKDDFQGAGFDDVYGATFGLNIKPHANVVIRPEVRFNWDFPAAAGLPNGDSDLTVFGIDTYLTF